MIYMSFVHGLRVSEMRKLRFSDLCPEEGYLHIHRLKSGFSTTPSLLPEEVNVIKLWMEVRSLMFSADSECLFLSRMGKPLSRK